MKPKHAMEIVNKRPGNRWGLSGVILHILTSPTARIYQRAMDDTPKHELSKQKHAKSLGVCSTLVQAILTKKQLFLMFSKPMVWILVCSPWDLTCFSNPNPTSEIWPKLDGSIKKEQE